MSDIKRKSPPRTYISKKVERNPVNNFKFITKNPSSLTVINLSGTGISKISNSICEYSNAQMNLENNSLCDQQISCINEKIDRNFQYCIEPIIEFVEVIK